MTVELGILLALACALTTNVAFLAKHRGACAAPAVELHHPLRSAGGLFRSRWFAIGMAIALGAWLLHVGALALAPISIVQAVLAGGLAMLAVLAERLFGLSVGTRQWLGVGLTALGLVLLAVTLPKSEDAHAQFSLTAMLGFELGLLAIGGVLVMGKRLRGSCPKRGGALLGMASGILFGVSDVALKALTGLLGDGGVLALVSPWTAVAALASVLAFYASARGLQDGEAVPVITLTATAANVTAIAGGIIVFGDPLAGDTLGIVVQALAFALVIAAAALTPGPLRAARPTA